MPFDISQSVPAITVFLQGLLSFFSPCVLPLVPLYVSYLAGGTRTADENGAVHYRRKTIFLNTLFFVAGVSFTFFLLGLGFTALGQFFNGHQRLFATIGGIIVILFGLFQLGVFQPKLLNREQRLPLNLGKMAMNPLTALLLGFTFSFSWTPCVGPALASVLLMASSAASSAAGFLLIGVYTLGFVIPFLAVGLFTGALLELFRKYRKALAYTVKIGGVLMILMGVMMITGWMNSLTGYLSSFGGASGGGAAASSSASAAPAAEGAASSAPAESQAEEDRPQVAAPDFTLKDQYGVEHTISDYKGKVVFLNFWTTWCGYCKQEMPDIESLYQEYGLNQEDVVMLGVANPRSDASPFSQDSMTAEEIGRFLEENGYTYPTIMDETGEMFAAYGVRSFPTTFMIDKDGNVYGYVTGALSKAVMQDIISQTMNAG